LIDQLTDSFIHSFI